MNREWITRGEKRNLKYFIFNFTVLLKHMLKKKEHSVHMCVCVYVCMWCVYIYMHIYVLQNEHWNYFLMKIELCAWSNERRFILVLEIHILRFQVLIEGVGIVSPWFWMYLIYDKYLKHDRFVPLLMGVFHIFQFLHERVIFFLPLKLT